ncbi:MAG: hypothetical protein IT371_18760 [Deltaproteobacteria bacterium]|nr:hypothetical protein [Deltaproteobacteria bacterium]
MDGRIDLHCHVLPGLDDGPAELEAAVALARGLETLGFDVIHPTPHQKARAWAPTREEREGAADLLRQELAASEAKIRIAPPGGENMWDELFLSRWEDFSFPCYEGDKALLVEISPVGSPPQLLSRLFDLQIKGRLPVLAHVERYLDLMKDDERVEQLGSKAALLVNLTTLGGQGGWRLRSRARKLTQRGLIHAAATDAHSTDDLAAAAAGIDWIRHHLGEEGVARLLVEGPKAILAGELPQW